jgi:hypothetical protein
MTTIHPGSVESTLSLLADNPVIILMNRLRLPKIIIDDTYRFFSKGVKLGKLQKFLFLIGDAVSLSKACMCHQFLPGLIVDVLTLKNRTCLQLYRVSEQIWRELLGIGDGIHSCYWLGLRQSLRKYGL